MRSSLEMEIVCKKCLHVQGRSVNGEILMSNSPHPPLCTFIIVYLLVERSFYELREL